MIDIVCFHRVTVTTAETFGGKLRAHLEEHHVTRRGLAKQIAEQTGQNPENARRMLYKWIEGGVDPTVESRKVVTDVLGLDEGALDPDDEEESLYDALVKVLGRAKLQAALERTGRAA
jgi:DNA-binding phage protein